MPVCGSPMTRKIVPRAVVIRTRRLLTGATPRPRSPSRVRNRSRAVSRRAMLRRAMLRRMATRPKASRARTLRIAITMLSVRPVSFPGTRSWIATACVCSVLLVRYVPIALQIVPPFATTWLHVVFFDLPRSGILAIKCWVATQREVHHRLFDPVSLLTACCRSIAADEGQSACAWREYFWSFNLFF